MVIRNNCCNKMLVAINNDLLKFPDRLDEKLTEILKKEYGLNSWKDYKKAPPEFQTDEWWKKRGL